MVYVLDLGLAEEYWDRAVGQHVPLCKDDGFFGTTFFASRHAQKGWKQGRRDDMEAAGYMFVALLQGTLPWSRSWSLSESDEGWFEHCAKQKSLLPLAAICGDCPREFLLYLKHCRGLGFSEEPD